MKAMVKPHQPLDPQPLGPKKTLFVMVVVIGCIAILWPKVFYPMLFSGPQKPNVIKDHRSAGCCDVVLDTDEFTNTSAKIWLTSDKPTFRKHLNLFTEEISIRQERPPHLRTDGIHPAMRERGRAIHPALPTVPITDRPHHVPPIPPKIIDGRPGPIPGMRPPMGAGSHHQPQGKANSVNFMMSLYTIGIIALSVYTLMKILCKKSPTAPYNEVKTDQKFREQVFDGSQTEQMIKRPDDGSTKLAWKDHEAIVTAIQGIIDAANEQILEHKTKEEQKQQDEEPSNHLSKDTTIQQNGDIKPLENGHVKSHEIEIIETQPEVKETVEEPIEVKKPDRGKVQVLGIEVTATCEDGKRWGRPSSPLIPPFITHRHHEEEPEEKEEPHPIYIEAPLEPDSQILVADTDTKTEEIFEDELHGELEDPAVVLSGRMTLSLITPRVATPISLEKNSEAEHEKDKTDEADEMQIEVNAVEVVEDLHGDNEDEFEQEVEEVEVEEVEEKEVEVEDVEVEEVEVEVEDNEEHATDEEVEEIEVEEEIVEEVQDNKQPEHVQEHKEHDD